MIANETINSARLGLQAAIRGVQDFDAALTEREALALLVAVADAEGVPYSSRGGHDLELYDAVRRRVG